MNKTLICHTDALSEPGSRGFSIDVNGENITGLVVQKDGMFYAYKNSCPHTGSPLDWVEHQFLDMDDALIQCAVHDARFVIEDGTCIAGPCIGESLQKLNIEHLHNQLFLLHNS